MSPGDESDEYPSSTHAAAAAAAAATSDMERVDSAGGGDEGKMMLQSLLANQARQDEQLAALGRKVDALAGAAAPQP